MTTHKNNGDYCDHCHREWTEVNNEQLYKVDGRWTCDECTCPSDLEDL